MSDQYTHAVPGLDVVFVADRLRRDRSELIGELTVRCGLPGARTVNGFLSTGDFNFSSVRARQERAKLLAARSQTNGEVDWFLLLEEFSQRVFESERTGDPAVKLRELPRPERDDDIKIDRFTFPRRHPTIMFGDGGTAKSYTALYLGGKLVQQNFSVGLFDWELAGEDHRDRYERLFGSDMPENLFYCRCERPLTAESDRLQRIVREHKLDYTLFDSVAFACDGAPESAEVAGEYFRAFRKIGCGGLHIARITKTSETSDQKPFGSAFWHNGARSTWNVQVGERDGDDNTLRLGFFNRKANLGPLRKSVGYVVTFTSERTLFESADVADTPSLASKLTIRQRLDTILRSGTMTVHEVSTALDVEPNSIYKTVNRNQKHFILLEGGRVGRRM